jgi:hypothetical protein
MAEQIGPIPKYLPDIFKKETIKVKKFDDVNEAVLFLAGLLNKQADALQDIYRQVEESNLKEHEVIRTALYLLCEKLQVYGLNISEEELFKEARAHIDKNWHQIKREVAKHRAARSKAVDDFLKDTQ